MQNNYKSGDWSRHYNRTGQLPHPHTLVASPTTALEALRNLVDERDQPRDTQETYIMPVVEKKKPAAPVVICPPLYIEYILADNPLTMLFGASVGLYQKYQRLPDFLYISPYLLPVLKYQTETIEEREYDGYFWFPSMQGVNKHIRHIPVLTEEYLPDLLKTAIEGNSIGINSVIAASER